MFITSTNVANKYFGSESEIWMTAGPTLSVVYKFLPYYNVFLMNWVKLESNLIKKRSRYQTVGKYNEKFTINFHGGLHPQNQFRWKMSIHRGKISHTYRMGRWNWHRARLEIVTKWRASPFTENRILVSMSLWKPI